MSSSILQMTGKYYHRRHPETSHLLFCFCTKDIKASVDDCETFLCCLRKKNEEEVDLFQGFERNEI